jgi:hypothetical protein
MEKEKRKSLELVLLQLRDVFLKLNLSDLKIKIYEDGSITYYNEHFEHEDKVEGGVYPNDTSIDIERLYDELI